MGILACKRCGATAEAATIAEAEVLLDCGVGITKGRPCSSDKDFFYWDGAKAYRKEYVLLVRKPSASVTKPKASTSKKKTTITKE